MGLGNGNGARGEEAPARVAEIGCVGALIVAEEQDAEQVARVMEWLRPKMFADSALRMVCAAVLGVRRGGLVCDPATLFAWLEEHGDLDSVGGPEAIARIVEGTVTAANLEYHAGLVREAYERREIEELGVSITRAGGDRLRPPAETWAWIRERAGEEKAARARTYPLISDLQAETLAPPVWGIDGLYPQGGLAVLFGQRGKGKTFLVMGWSFSHATGHPWLGRTVHRGPVVYIMAEGRGGLGNRVRAQKEHMGIQGEVGVYFLPTAVPMLDDPEVDRLIGTIETLATPPAAVVWDTLSRTFVGGDENSSKDMARYVAAIDRVKEACGAVAIVQHHTGHTSADRERGSSVLGGAADTIMALREEEGGGLLLACEKQKDGPEFTPIPLELKYLAGAGSCITQSPRGAMDQGPFSLPAVDLFGLRSLHDGFLDDGATATAWQLASGMAHSSFFKARTSLVRRGLVRQKGDGRGARYLVSPEGLALLMLRRSTEGPC